MTAVISEISDFDHFLNILKSHIKVSFESQNGNLESYLVVLSDLKKNEIESKFCQNVKIFMTAVISEVSDFDHFLNILKSHSKQVLSPKWNSGELFSCSEWFLKVWNWVKTLSKCEIFHDRGN